MKKFGFVLRTLLAKAVASTFAVLLAQTAWAHPHEWIDLTVQFKFDEEKRLIALEQSWLFDPFFSAYVLDELTADRPNRKRVLEQGEALGPEMVSNLSKHGYLNNWTFQDTPIEAVNGTFVSVQLKNRNRMELTFQVDLPEPLDLTTGGFEYSVFDPLYYIEILHAERFRPRLRGGPRGCRSTIIQPEPDEDYIIYAAELDRTDNAEEGLGQHFAERVVISCQR